MYVDASLGFLITRISSVSRLQMPHASRPPPVAIMSIKFYTPRMHGIVTDAVKSVLFKSAL